jgi:hypothetical protein
VNGLNSYLQIPVDAGVAGMLVLRLSSGGCWGCVCNSSAVANLQLVDDDFAHVLQLKQLCRTIEKRIVSSGEAI